MNRALEIEHVSKSFTSDSVFAVSDVSLQLEKGKVLGLLGESGCGKTTLLRIIAGFEIPDSGTVTVDGRTVVSNQTIIPPGDRHIGMIFQDFALFPHLSVMDNILFGVREKDKQKRASIAQKMLELTDLTGLEKRRPGEISGGQQQRLALARCMATSPRLLLLDEPFSNLDVTLRQQVRQQVSDLLKVTETSAVMVTHDIDDAISLCDEIAVMKEGKILQVASFEEIYDRPANEYVARLSGDVVDLSEVLHYSLPDQYKDDSVLLIRPEKLRLRGSRPRFSAQIAQCRFAGKGYEYLLISNGFELVLWANEKLQPKSEVNLFFDNHDLLQF